MDVVVVDIPLKFGMMLSRSWESKLKGTLQMDMSYASVSIFRIQRRIFREQKLAHMVTNVERKNNHPTYSFDIEMGSSIFLMKGMKTALVSRMLPSCLLRRRYKGCGK